MKIRKFKQTKQLIDMIDKSGFFEIYQGQEVFCIPYSLWEDVKLKYGDNGDYKG